MCPRFESVMRHQHSCSRARQVLAREIFLRKTRVGSVKMRWLKKESSQEMSAEHEKVSLAMPDHDVSRVLGDIADVIASRKGADPASSYVAKLFSRAPDGILKKVGEEAAECIMAAKDASPKDIIYETADLWFHTMVMLAHVNLRPEQVIAELERREGMSGIAEKLSRSK